MSITKEDKIKDKILTALGMHLRDEGRRRGAMRILLSLEMEDICIHPMIYAGAVSTLVYFENKPLADSIGANMHNLQDRHSLYSGIRRAAEEEGETKTSLKLCHRLLRQFHRFLKSITKDNPALVFDIVRNDPALVQLEDYGKSYDRRTLLLLRAAVAGISQLGDRGGAPKPGAPSCALN